MAVQANIFINPSFHKSIHKASLPLTFKLSRRLSLASTNLTVAAAPQLNNASNQEHLRPLAHFRKDIWDDVLRSISLDNLKFESWSKQVEVLKKRVKAMLMGQIDHVEKIKFINILYRLGVKYHFENMIEEQLSCLFVSISEIFYDNDTQLQPLYWSKDLNIASRLCYARHRMVEVFFWAVAIHIEPHHANARNIFAKLLYPLISLDDTYDAYGTFHELQCLTQAIQRWDIKALDDLPADYLKIFYEVLINVHDEVEKMVSNEGRPYSISFEIEEVKKLANLYLQEAKWTYDGYMPTFYVYLDVALYSSAAILTTVLGFVGMEEADVNAFEWLTHSDRSKFLQAMIVIGRLYNEIETNTNEEERGLVGGVTCYMKPYGVSKEETIEEFRRRIEIAWKDLNEDYMEQRVVPKQILKRVINVARAIDLFYKDDDGFTSYENVVKDHIKNVLLEPIPI